MKRNTQLGVHSFRSVKDNEKTPRSERVSTKTALLNIKTQRSMLRLLELQVVYILFLKGKKEPNLPTHH